MADLPSVARSVLEARYLRHDDSGDRIETPEELFQRVAENLAAVEARYDRDPSSVESEFLRLLRQREFLPNSPTLMNAGTPLQQLAACFVLPLQDSLKSIFNTLRDAALIHQSGGGTGFAFSRLRPRGDPVKDTGGVASGPVSFMKIFDAATEQIKQGGRRRGANMGVLDVTHPDIARFIRVKAESDQLMNFNLSVATDERFWEGVRTNGTFPLINPRTSEQVGERSARRTLHEMAEAAWECGDPGVLFMDRINHEHPLPGQGSIQATNPCGEVPLLPNEACVLGSINLGRMTTDGGVDWDKLARTTRLGVRFLDNTIDASRFPLDAIEQTVSRNRKIGLGVMGFHDMLVDLDVGYYSERALRIADDVMEFIADRALDASRDLAQERGPFPAFVDSDLETPVRNATRTSIAPTGTISLIAGCSASIEPIYNVVYTKHVLGGLSIRNDRFMERARAGGFDTPELMDRIAKQQSIQPFDEIPEDVKRLFPTAHDIPAKFHLRMQGAFQRHVDNAVSKTVNLPSDASVEDIRYAIRRARALKLKGVTLFRSGSRREQVLGGDPLKEECVSECDYVLPRQEPSIG